MLILNIWPDETSRLRHVFQSHFPLPTWARPLDRADEMLFQEIMVHPLLQSSFLQKADLGWERNKTYLLLTAFWIFSSSRVWWLSLNVWASLWHVGGLPAIGQELRDISKMIRDPATLESILQYVANYQFGLSSEFLCLVGFGSVLGNFVLLAPVLLC